MCKHKKDPAKCCNIVNLVFSIINLLLLIACFVFIALKFPAKCDLDFDYYGVIVGILSLLVTVLIGWNIYSVVDFKKITESIKSEMDVLKNDTSTNIDLNSKQINKVHEDVSDINKNIATLEQEYYERIKNVESFFIETSFNLVHAKQDETFIVVVVRGFEFVLWLAQKKDFDKACEELKIVHNGIKKT